MEFLVLFKLDVFWCAYRKMWGMRKKCLCALLFDLPSGSQTCSGSKPDQRSERDWFRSLCSWSVINNKEMTWADMSSQPLWCCDRDRQAWGGHYLKPHRALSCLLRITRMDNNTASVSVEVRCNLQLPSVPGTPRGQWPRVQSRWHHAAFYQWLQWHTAPAGGLPGARCPRLGWE